MAIENDWRDNIVTRIATLETHAAVTTQRLESMDRRFDKVDRDNEGMDKKLDMLIQRNDFQDGGANTRNKLIKAAGVWGVAIASGSGMTYFFNWLFGRGHP